MKRIYYHYYPCLLALVSVSCWATPVPQRNLGAVLNGSDIIVVGFVASVTNNGTTELSSNGTQIHATIAEAHVQVKSVLAGGSLPNEISIQYAIPDMPIGYRTIGAHTLRLLLLQRHGDTYSFSDPHFPSLPAVDTAISQAASIIDRVSAVESGVLSSSQATPQDKEEAVYALGSLDNANALDVLARNISDTSIAVRLGIASQLSLHNNLKGAVVASQVLLNPPSGTPEYLLHNLRVGIRDGVKDESAVPNISAMLQSEDIETREAAAEALRHIGSPSVIDPLVRSLADPDKKVRYQAAAGLAEITGQRDWHPSLIEFSQHETKYLDHWAEWTRNR